MWNCACKVVLFSGLLSIVSAVATGNSTEKRRSNVIFPRSVGTVDDSTGSPIEWTMSKANLVAEFYTSEPAPTVGSARGRSHKGLFSFLRNSNVSSNGKNYAPLYSKHGPGEGNLVASGTNFNQPSVVPFALSRNEGLPSYNGPNNSPSRIKFPQQNYIIPAGNPASGYPQQQNVRPPRRPNPPPPPTAQQLWDSSRPIAGLRPPPNAPIQQKQQSEPPPMYLPPRGNQPVSHFPPPPPLPSLQMQLPNQNQPPVAPSQAYLPPVPLAPPSPPAQSSPPSGYQPPAPPSGYQPPARPAPPSGYQPPSPPNFPARNNSTFVPSQYLPPSMNPQPGPPPPPQILDTYRNQAVYPAPSPPRPQQGSAPPMIFIMSNSSSPSSFNHRPTDTLTNYEQNAILHHYPIAPPPQTSYQSQQAQPSQNALELTEPLSQILAEANAKSGGEAVDKTIRFVIHKPEDEDIVKNAILEDAQNRYEDVKFVQGPTLKVQRKETVYLPPKKKTVVYILLKEPQIDTDVQVMSPQEDEPAPEVYITYQKSDGAVRTKHYSPKPIKEEDMKKYLDIEAETYGAPEESRIHPMFSKSTSVSLSTSSKASRTSSSTSVIAPSKESRDQENPILLTNHNFSDNSGDKNATQILAPLKTSRLLSTSSNNSTPFEHLHHHRSRKGPRAALPFPSPRRFLRNPIQCPTLT